MLGLQPGQLLIHEQLVGGLQGEGARWWVCGLVVSRQHLHLLPVVINE
jgi:hypothetical protein